MTAIPPQVQRSGTWGLTRRKMTKPQLETTAQNIDHQDVVVGIVDKSGVVEAVNELRGTKGRECLSANQVAKA